MDSELRGTALSPEASNSFFTHVVDLSFPRCWEAEILAARPPILPARHYVYPRVAEEVERGALEVLIRPGAASATPFLATCALGFRDPTVPAGLWATPKAEEICAVAGGYAYLIDTTAPERFTMIPYRPVLAVRAVVAENLLLFIGNRSIIAWGPDGQAWESSILSDEGVSIVEIEGSLLRGTGWQLMSGCEESFHLDLRTGKNVS